MSEITCEKWRLEQNVSYSKNLWFTPSCMLCVLRKCVTELGKKWQRVARASKGLE